jgi:hypothetical protein
MNASCFAFKHLPAWATPERLRYSLRLDAETPSNNTIKGMHFHAYKKLREGYAKEVLALVGGKRPGQPIEKAGLVVVRHCAGELDWDNALGGLKPVLDCLVCPSDRNPSGVGLIHDDKPRFMPCAPAMYQLPAKRGQGFAQLFIFDVSEG